MAGHERGFGRGPVGRHVGVLLPSFSPTGLADGFGAGRSPTRVNRPCCHDGFRAIHPRVVVPRFPYTGTGFGACARSRLL
ncbi:hypothetical protein STRIP9103_04452 [Streptomyces ipomoeae 91-03]|uniref:Uncharacterized protein n=1 Tax=Streptomyces ipomoeae 91-03 TaxID=698759 RepID=L1KVE5_9ACTN|nr:hypothetical protein STRIP9103_04452 [Streptomyces ipomoeae 91-03]